MSESYAILCVAITGSGATKSRHPIAVTIIRTDRKSTHAAFEAGRSICHAHCAQRTNETPRRTLKKFGAAELRASRKPLPRMIIRSPTGGRSGRAKARGGKCCPCGPTMASLSWGRTTSPLAFYVRKNPAGSGGHGWRRNCATVAHPKSVHPRSRPFGP